MAKMEAAPRIQRDFARIMSLIKTTALIRHYHRQIDKQSRIVATLADYETVRELVGEMYIDSSTGATKEMLELVETIIRLNVSRSEDKKITNTTLAKELHTGVKQITRRAKRAIALEWLVNREQRKAYAADYAPGEQMPEIDGLPILSGSAPLIPADSTMSTVPEANNEGVDMLTPLTDDDIHPAVDSREIILGMPISRALEVWRREGAPLIHLGPGENSLDLEELLSLPDVHERDLLAVKQWLDRVMP